MLMAIQVNGVRMAACPMQQLVFPKNQIFNGEISLLTHQSKV
jgi:hypothetical protein